MYNHPYLKQEVNRATSIAQDDERSRVLRLITYRRQIINRDKVLYQVDEVAQMLDELYRAVQQGFQR